MSVPLWIISLLYESTKGTRDPSLAVRRSYFLFCLCVWRDSVVTITQRVRMSDDASQDAPYYRIIYNVLEQWYSRRGAEIKIGTLSASAVHLIYNKY